MKRRRRSPSLERRHPRATRTERVAQNTRQLQDQFLGALGLHRRSFRDHVERVEQKMMIELAAQRFELTAQRQLAQPQMLLARRSQAERKPAEDPIVQRRACQPRRGTPPTARSEGDW